MSILQPWGNKHFQLIIYQRARERENPQHILYNFQFSYWPLWEAENHHSPYSPNNNISI